MYVLPMHYCRAQIISAKKTIDFCDFGRPAQSWSFGGIYLLQIALVPSLELIWL